MNFSYEDIKKALYFGLVIVGIALLLFALYVFKLASADNDPLRYILPGIVLVLVGTACIFFGVEMFFFRDDPDIWL